jgi:hypothetical protein
MRKIVFLIILTVITACSTDTRFDDIDFIAYSYREFETDSPVFEREWRIICTYYAYIEKDYNCRVMVQRIYKNPGIWYYQINRKEPTFRKIIDNIITTSSSITTEIDFRPKPPVLYDGSDLKIRINKSNNNKLIHFWEYQNESAVYEKLFHYLDSLYMNHSLIEIKDNEYIQKRRQDFIKFVIKSDSLLRPLPPNIPRDLDLN